MDIEIKERPILMNAAMVRAVLDGRKTQTRRLVDGMALDWLENSKFVPAFVSNYENDMCKYGRHGDRLWVRETWGVVSFSIDANDEMQPWIPDRPATKINEMKFGNGYYRGHSIYRADGEFNWSDEWGDEKSCWHPSIHMPRAASRILLEIVSVRVERLGDISTDDIRSEGIVQRFPKVNDRFTPDILRGQFIELWESIGGAGSWAANPWVWVVEFKRVDV